MRIVVDTNVIVSALVFGGLPQKVLDLAAEGICMFYFSAPIQAEVERILEEKFGWSRKEIQARVALLWSCGTQVFPQIALAVITDDPDDGRILECVIAAQAQTIVSEDRHLVRLVHFNRFPS